MKNLVILAFLLIPSVSFAAPLTTDQATSLIAVVQSSTTTPASAFTNLITAFSNITVPQAESLITVVQAAPGVPATAFINMLLAFTVDPTPATTQTPTLGAVQQSTTPVIPSSPTTTQTAPVVQSNVMQEITLEERGQALAIRELEIHYKENGHEVDNAPITISTTVGYFIGAGEHGKDPGAGIKSNTVTYKDSKIGVFASFYTDGEDYRDGDKSQVATPGAIFTVTVRGITKTIQGGAIFKTSNTMPL